MHLSDNEFLEQTGLPATRVLEHLPDAVFVLRPVPDEPYFRCVFRNAAAAMVTDWLEAWDCPVTAGAAHVDLGVENAAHDHPHAAQNGAGAAAKSTGGAREGPCFNWKEYLKLQFEKCMTLRRPVSFVVHLSTCVGESVLSPVIDTRGQVTHLICVVRDITDHYRRERLLERLAYHDSLTGLLNRQAGRERLRQMRDMARDQGRYLCLLMLDSDNLKQINDTHGHSVGDRYLREVAIRLRRSVRTTDLVTRIGGDEFFVAAITDGDDEAVTIAERILAAVQQPWHYHGIQITPRLSIGIAVYPRHSESLSALIRIADKAMYAAKRSGGGRYIMAPVPADRTAQPPAGRPDVPET